MLKIRSIQDTSYEPLAMLIGIHQFDDLDTEIAENEGEEYYFACTLLNQDGKLLSNPMCGFDHQTPNKPNDGYKIHRNDKFDLPTPTLYAGLGRILKKHGYVFNKKKCRFEKKIK